MSYWMNGLAASAGVRPVAVRSFEGLGIIIAITIPGARPGMNGG